MRTGILAAITWLAANSAFAACDPSKPPGPNNVCTAVPEISAMEGTAALAALAAVVLLLWERRRRSV